MSAPQFTPGPWQIGASAMGCTSIDCGDELIATVEDALHAGNARLIASAPELYEALDDVLVHCLADIEAEEQKDEPNEDALTIYRARRDKAEAALAKARGAKQ